MAFELLSRICMMLSAEALDILAYLETDSGRFFSLPEISRRAGGRRLFEETPGWARRLLPQLLEEGLIEINPRGHYRRVASTQPSAQAGTQACAQAKSTPTPPKRRAKIVADDYFPTGEVHGIVGGDYFPSSD